MKIDTQNKTVWIKIAIGVFAAFFAIVVARQILAFFFFKEVMHVIDGNQQTITAQRESMRRDMEEFDKKFDRAMNERGSGVRQEVRETFDRINKSMRESEANFAEMEKAFKADFSKTRAEMMLNAQKSHEDFEKHFFHSMESETPGEDKSAFKKNATPMKQVKKHAENK